MKTPDHLDFRSVCFRDPFAAWPAASPQVRFEPKPEVLWCEGLQIPDHREGGAQGLAIVIEFDSIDSARTFHESEAYSEARSVREKISDTDLILVEGL